MRNTRDSNSPDICSAVEEMDRTSTGVLRSPGLPSPDCSCSPCISRSIRRTRYELYQIEQAAKEYAGLI